MGGGNEQPPKRASSFRKPGDTGKAGGRFICFLMSFCGRNCIQHREGGAILDAIWVAFGTIQCFGAGSPRYRPRRGTRVALVYVLQIVIAETPVNLRELSRGRRFDNCQGDGGLTTQGVLLPVS